MMKRLLFSILLVIACGSLAAAADTARVLFIGNSFTGTNDLPEQVRLLAAAKGDVLIKTSHSPGGVTLKGHSSDAMVLSLIDAGGWDYVVLQEQSQTPAFPDAQVKADFYPYAKTLVTRIRSKNPCARVVFFMTWGYRTGDASNCPFFPPLCSYEGMDSLLRLRYMSVSDSNNAMLCPVGSTWRRIRSLHPSINLYSGDDRHPAEEGTYAAACSFYSTIFRKSPVGAAYTGPIAPTIISDIQLAAEDVVYDSLAFWNQWWAQTGMPVAAFSHNATGKTVQFSNGSVNAGSYLWSFGDGATSIAASPAHTYATDGSYAVRLIARSVCGDPDTVSRTIQVSASSVAGGGRVPAVALFPNPAQTRLTISMPAGSYERVELFDISGRILLRDMIPPRASQHQMDISSLSAGIYELLLSGPEGRIRLQVQRVD